MSGFDDFGALLCTQNQHIRGVFDTKKFNENFADGAVPGAVKLGLLGTGDEAADSTDNTEPIHLVLQHLRESFSLS